ncbi:MAG: glutathione S-transferase family protein [Pseudomonadota bacterium]
MVVVVPSKEGVAPQSGLHLYHGAISNCSMRVRMTLIEKGLEWESHHLDLKKKENISEDYFALNPNGLVPTLVDDGVVHIESNDIIDYLDYTYPAPSLRPVDNETMLDWLKLAASIHVPAVKPYVYATMMQKKVKKTAEEQAKYDALQSNEELKTFHNKHAGGKAFDDTDVKEALVILDDSFSKLEAALEGQPWVMGAQYSLADISWVPLHFVLVGCGYPFENYPNITRWAASFQDRDSFKEGVLKWCPDFSKV